MTGRLALLARTAAAAVIALTLFSGGCAPSRWNVLKRPSQAVSAPSDKHVEGTPVDKSRAESRFAAGVAMDLEAERLEELFTYQRLSRGTRQPSLLRDAKSFRQGALAAFDEALKSDPGSPTVLRRKGDVLLELGRADEALTLYKQADASIPAETKWYFRVAGQMEVLGRTADAAQLLERAAASAESSELRQIAYLELGDLYGKLEQLDDAERVYRLALAVKPADPRRVMTSLGQALATRLKEDPTGVRRMLISVLIKAGKLDAALAEAQAAYAGAPRDARALASLAAVQIARKEYDAAVAAAKAFVAAKPSDQVAVVTLMDALAAAGRTDEAVDAAKAYTALKADDIKVRQEAVRIYRKAGRAEDAEKFVFADAPGGFPSYPVALALLDVYVSGRDADKAFALAKKVLEHNALDVNIALQMVGQLWAGLPAERCAAFCKEYGRQHPEDIRVTYGYAEVLKGKGMTEEAGPLFVEIAEKGGQFGDAYEAAAKYLMERGESYRAATLFLKGVENGFVSRPEASVQSMTGGVTDAAAVAAKLAADEESYTSARTTLYEIVAGLYLEASEDARAETYYRKALEAPDPPLMDYAGLAIALYRQSKTADAIALVEDLMKKGQGAPPLVRMLVSMLSNDGDYKSAEEIAGKLISEQPTNIENHLSLVGVYVDEGNYEAAERELELARGLSEGDDTALNKVRYMLGLVYDEQGRDDEAAAIWRENLQAVPDDPNTSNALGYHYADRGIKLDEAKTLVEKALKSEPDNSAYLDSLGWVYYKMGDYNLAVETLKKAAETEKDPVIYDHLGDALLKAGDRQGAVEAWTKSLANKPKEKDRARVQDKITQNSTDKSQEETK